MAATIKIKNSSTASAVPTSSDLVQGELAVNVTDKRIFTENASGTIVELGTNPTSIALPAGSASAPTLLASGDTNTGVFFPAADTVGITTGGTERARVDSSGNLGLGVTPSAWSSTYTTALQLKNGYAALSSNFSLGYANLSCNAYEDGNDTWKYVNSYPATRYRQTISGNHAWFTAASGTAGNAISFTQAMTLDASGNLGIGKTSPTVPLSFADSAGTAGTANKISLYWATGETYGLYGFGVSSGQLDYVTGGAHVFYSRSTNASTERARIDSSGNLLVGTTTVNPSGNAFSVDVGSGITRTGHANGTASGTAYSVFVYNGGAIGTITQNGTTAVAYNTSSDYRLKHDIAPMTGALAKVAALKPVTYKWNADNSDGEGFIAHELAEVCPHAVTGEKDAVDADGNPVYQGIDTSFLVATLTAALQEMKAIIDDQAARIAALEAK